MHSSQLDCNPEGGTAYSAIIPFFPVHATAGWQTDETSGLSANPRLYVSVWKNRGMTDGELSDPACHNCRFWLSCLVGEAFGSRSWWILKGSPFLDPCCQVNEVCILGLRYRKGSRLEV